MVLLSSIRQKAYQPDPFAFTCFFPPNLCSYSDYLDEKPFYSTESIDSGFDTDFTVSDTDDESTQESTESVLTLFKSIARACPTAIAIDAECAQVTYADLDAASSTLASRIAPCVIAGQPIPLLTTLSTSAIIGILAILKAGGIYVPVDCSQWPEEHIASVLEAIGGSVLVYSTEFARIAKTRPGYSTTIPISQCSLESSENATADNASSLEDDTLYHMRRDTEDLACVIFTSGTTGKPKGVMIRHEALANFVISRRDCLNPNPGARSLLILSISFDACTGYLFSMLCHGGTVVLASPDTIQERSSTCSIIVLTPSMLKSLMPPPVSNGHYIPSMSHRHLRTIILGGETASQSLLSAWHPSGATWTTYNDYGPTEATCGVLTGRILWDDSSAKFANNLLGMPIPGVVVKLRGDDGDEVTETDRDGEILIGGVCLAAGYWKDKERTAERFITWNGRIFYSTGDCGRWQTAGDNRRIEFLGRRDRIVKNRGFLVNLETEVDATALRPEAVSTWRLSGAFTVMVEGRMCMLVSPEDVDAQGLRKWMAERVPAYQVPDRILTAESLPKGRTGKVDPKAVLITFQRLGREEYPCLRTSVTLEQWEADLTAVISRILGLQRPIRAHEKFVELGGHSLAAVELSGWCRRLGANIRARDVLLSNSVGDLLETCRHARQSQAVESTPLHLPTRVCRTGRITSTQLALIQASDQVPGSSMIQTSFLQPTKSLPALKHAWRSVLESESIFRTTFDVSQCTQTVQDDAMEFQWNEVVVTTREAYEAESHDSPSIGISTAFKAITFHEESRLIWTIHHALIDGVSAYLLLRKVHMALQGMPLQPGPSFLQVVDNIQQAHRSQSQLAQSFWNQQKLEFPNAMGKIDLLPKPEGVDSRPERRLMTAECKTTLDISSEEITALAKSLGVTPVTLFYAAWGILLSNYTSSTQVVLGAVMAGRDAPLPQIEETIGPLVCTAPLRLLVESNLSIATLVKDVFAKLHCLSQYQWLPDEDESSSFHTAVASQQNLPDQPFEIESIRETSAIPITLLIEDQWSFCLLYRTDTYTSMHMSQVAEGYRNIFRAMFAVDANVASCWNSMISSEERTNILTRSNAFSHDTTVERSTETVLDIFEKTVQANPQLRAIEKGSHGVTFRELDLASTKLAERIAQHTAIGDVVGLHAERSINWLIGIFGIIKAGAIYCPLDEALPTEVRVDMFTRSGATLFLVPHSSALRFAPPSAAASLAIDEALEAEDGPTLRSVPRDPRAIVYMCFTSGSTGKPKGVVVEHGGLVEFQRHLASRMYAAPGRRMMQFLSVGFDGSMIEIFSALCYGTTLVLRTDNDNALAALKDVDIAVITPSAAEDLDPRNFPNLKYLYFAGEPLTQQAVDSWAPGRKLFNYYGPTEATVGAIQKLCEAGKPVTIGRPIPSMRAYILNDRRELVPTGVVGEIVLAGVQVARGYIGMPAETNAKFLPDVVSGRPAERMYLTGDLGYWTEDGEIVCLGRKDRQVKVRGFRINLGSVEHALCSHPEVQAVAVAVSQGSLIAWVRPCFVDVNDVARLASTSLPVHARPQRIIALDSFPLTKNGKLDYKALLSNLKDETVRSPCLEELSGTEAMIAKEWRDLLKIDDERAILPSDSFTHLGGHSVRQLVLAARLSEMFKVRVPVRLALNCGTLRELAYAVDQLKQSEVQQSLTGRRELGQFELSPMELEWWFKYQAASPSGAATFNVPFVCSLSSDVDRELLADAWTAVIRNHKILSSRFVKNCQGRPSRKFSLAPPKAWLVGEVDVAKTINVPFNLSNDDLIRVFISPSKLVVVISHILCDLTALRTLVDEVSVAYNSHLEALPSPGGTTYMQVSSWYREPSPCDMKFWSNYLCRLPKGAGDSTPIDYSGSSQVFNIPSDLFHKISTFTTDHSATLYQTLLLATAITLQSLTKTSDTVLGTPFMNRTELSEMKAVGLFLQPLPFRLDFSDTCLKDGVDRDMDVSVLMERAKSSFRGILSHTVLWQHLLSHLGLEYQKDGGAHPVFDTVVTLHDYRETPPVSLDIAGAGSPEYVHANGAKFKLLFEYTVNTADEVLLRVEYNTQKLELEAVMGAYAGLKKALEAMCAGSSLRGIQAAILRPFDGLRYGT